MKYFTSITTNTLPKNTTTKTVISMTKTMSVKVYFLFPQSILSGVPDVSSWVVVESIDSLLLVSSSVNVASVFEFDDVDSEVDEDEVGFEVEGDVVAPEVVGNVEVGNVELGEVGVVLQSSLVESDIFLSVKYWIVSG